MEQAMLVETMPATFEMESTDFIMQECASRPPEKIIMMPKGSASGKKPGRASLLSIISGDRKSSSTSVSSGEDIKSPKLSTSQNIGAESPLTSPTQTTTPPAVPTSPSQPQASTPAAPVTSPNLATSPASPTSALISTSKSAALPTSPKPAAPATLPKPAAPATSPKPAALESPTGPVAQMKSSEPKDTKESEVVAKPAKKKPPPTLAKTFKSRSSSTKSVSTPSVTEGQEPKLLNPKEDDDDVFREEMVKITLKEGTTADKMCDIDTAIDKECTENNNTLVDKPASHLTLQVKSDVEQEGKEPAKCAAVVENEDINVVTTAIEEPGDAFQGDIELPPPIQSEPNADLDECDNMEFPPPPDMDFLTNNEMPGSSQLATNENDRTIDKAVGIISSKYDVSYIAMNNTQQDNSEGTKGTTLDVCKQTSTTVEHIICESTDTPTHESNITSSESAKLVSEEVEDVKVSTPSEDIVVEQMQPQGDNSQIAQGNTETSIVLDQKEQMTVKNEMDSSDDAETSTTLSEDLDSAIEVNFPQLPAASSFSTPEAAESTEDSSQAISEGKSSPAPGANEDGTLTLTQHLEENSSVRASTSHTPHSPPFNTSSESGDSGVESGIYSFSGETVTVKLRPTTNDNRKPDTTVPMFERNSTELKRVTFRETNNPINPAVTGARKSPAEEERIKKTGLSDDDISQAELFYKGHKTEVMVCPCLATLYFADSNSSENIAIEEWKPEHIGIPVLIYDTGNGKRPRGLTMVFAEKGTGFLLWKTVINYQSRWEVVEPVFHRLRVITTADKYAGIAFQDESSAKIFYENFKTCTADPEKNVLNNPNLQNKKKSRKEKKKSTKHKVGPLPNKSAISKPCEFTHVTQLKQSADGIMASAMVPESEEGGSEVGSPK